jgi:hypothetical protein
LSDITDQEVLDVLASASQKVLLAEAKLQAAEEALAQIAALKADEAVLIARRYFATSDPPQTAP